MIVVPDEFVSIKLVLCWYSNSLYFRFLFIAFIYLLQSRFFFYSCYSHYFCIAALTVPVVENWVLCS